MTQSLENQIEDLKIKIANTEMCKARANTRQQEVSDQRRIDNLKAQLKELES